MSCHLNSESIKKSAVRQVVVSPDRDGQRIDNFLNTQIKGVPKSAIYRIIRTGQVRVNGKRCKPGYKLAVGDVVRIPPVHVKQTGQVTVSEAVVEQIRAAILHEDSDYLVIDKPSGMAVHSGSQLPWGLIDVVRQMRPGEYLELAHRLDRETSGCIALARNGRALGHLSGQFRGGQVTKRYLCLMNGCLKEDRVDVDEPLRKIRVGNEHEVETDESGKPALTRFRLLQAFSDCSYVEVELYTGRTHQIRVHAAHLGLPLAGDARYGPAKMLRKWKARGLNRLFLHAHQLSFESLGGDLITCHSALPDPLRRVLDGLDR